MQHEIFALLGCYAA